MNYLPIAKEALYALAQAISQLAERLGGEFQRAVELILSCKVAPSCAAWANPV